MSSLLQKPLNVAYYPSCLVNFRLRFDEALTSIFAPGAPAQGELASNKTPNRAPTKPSPKPSFASGTSLDGLSFVVGRIPKSATLELTGYRQAWKFSLEFEYKDLPIDPRLLRACAVEIYVDAVPASDFALGMSERLPEGTFVSRGRRHSTLTPNANNLVMIGVVDGWVMEHNEGQSTVQMEGRDLRGVLLDSPLDIRKIRNIDLTKPIHDVVRQILDSHDFGDQITVEILEDDWADKKIPAPAEKSGRTRVRQGANGQNAHSAPAGGETLNYWDIIVQYCYLVGAIPFFAGKFGKGAAGATSVLRIRPSRSLFDDVKRTGNDVSNRTPFASGAVRSDTKIADWGVRKMVYGRDIKSLKFERKYSGYKPRIVECRCLNTDKKELLIARWPDTLSDKEKKVTNAKKTGVSPSGGHSDSQVLIVPVHGVADKNVLQQIAFNIYEEIGRGELGGAIETRSLASFGGDNQDPDLVFLRPGDAVEIVPDVRLLEDKLPLVGEYTEAQRQSFENRVKSVTDTIGDEKLARAITATERTFDLQRFFRVANVRMNWSTDGLALSFDYQNYIEARNLKPETTGPTKKKPKNATARVKRPRPGIEIISFEEGDVITL